MKFVVDTHTHTYASGHAYSTITENAQAAKANGLEILCTTDHAESMPGAPHFWFFSNQRVIPRFLSGVAIIRGIEANILNTQGEIDVNPTSYKALDWIIGSFHEPVFKPASKEEHTEALINVIKSGNIDALGHLGNPNFDFDFEAVAKCAAEHHVAIEINNSTLRGHSRVGSVDRCYQIARAVKTAGGYITTGSDSHFYDTIGEFELTNKLLTEVEMPVEKIITASSRQFLDFLALRGREAIAEFSDL
ncbi:putative histidinol phosphatase and related hydrolases of the PHP family [Vibrio maritimus]|uniref:Putative histidinol phosphatase and related hydrolases of the PHP family n=1 Tax=Vibrio maritimus TaxID=990268 RepID=A0A090TM63_9VIBR|nr:putative histidinol phosphatase and related hydrolases of the PHP family [Vibrio maritimus]